MKKYKERATLTNSEKVQKNPEHSWTLHGKWASCVQRASGSHYPQDKTT